MIKFRLYLDKDKEIPWLNDMARKGWALKNFAGGFYSFEPCEPGEFVYQIDFGNKFFSLSEDYLEFMEENHIEVLSIWGYWIFLRKKADEREFVLYTDVDSSIEHYTKILKLFKAVAIIELLCFFIELACAMYGSAVGFFGMFLIGAFFIGFLCAIATTKNTIRKLKERKGELPAGSPKAGNVSPALIAGLFLNMAAIAMNNSGSVSHNLTLAVQIGAILLMLVGLFRSRSILMK